MKNRHSIRLGLSTCPNDTFIFYALLENKIESPFTITPYFADVEELNKMSRQEELDFCKISIHAYAHISSRYWLLRSGGAMGHACGPLLVSRATQDSPFSAEKAQILIPGIYTTAYLYLQLAFPQIGGIKPMLFSEIIPAVARGDADAGLIIHESRFTYQEYSLVELMDLGVWWEQKTGYPIPLGGIAGKRSLPVEWIEAMEQAIRSSIQYAREHEDETLAYCQKYAQEMESAVMKSHITLYVNQFSEQFGSDGEAAIHFLMQTAKARGLLSEIPGQYFAGH